VTPLEKGVHYNTIKTLAGDMAKAHGVWIGVLSKLPLSVEEKSVLLARANLPDTRRAQLGDREAESRVIKVYAAAATYKEKRELVWAMARVGAPAFKRALFASLTTILVEDRGNYKVTTAMDVLDALGYLYPDEPLFGKPYLAVRSPLPPLDAEAITSFLRQVEAWGKQELGVELQGNLPHYISTGGFDI